MALNSLDKLESRFNIWRQQKRSGRESIPSNLLNQARRASAVHGVTAVMRATKIGHYHLVNKQGGDSSRLPACKPYKSTARRAPIKESIQAKPAASKPFYSRLEVAVPQATISPLIEVETPAGLKIRFFSLTTETVGLLSTFSGSRRIS
jgi:hypothetical protein